MSPKLKFSSPVPRLYKSEVSEFALFLPKSAERRASRETFRSILFHLAILISGGVWTSYPIAGPRDLVCGWKDAEEPGVWRRARLGRGAGVGRPGVLNSSTSKSQFKSSSEEERFNISFSDIPFKNVNKKHGRTPAVLTFYFLPPYFLYFPFPLRLSL